MDNVQNFSHDCELIGVYCKSHAKGLNTPHRKMEIVFVLQKGVYIHVCPTVLSVVTQVSRRSERVA